MLVRIAMIVWSILFTRFPINENKIPLIVKNRIFDKHSKSMPRPKSIYSLNIKIENRTHDLETNLWADFTSTEVPTGKTKQPKYLSNEGFNDTLIAIHKIKKRKPGTLQDDDWEKFKVKTTTFSCKSGIKLKLIPDHVSKYLLTNLAIHSYTGCFF